MIASGRDASGGLGTLSAMADPTATLAPAEAATRLGDGWQILDVRLEHERAEGHIAGSVHIELTELSARAGELDTERPVLVFCRSGSRSAMAVAALRGAGYDAHDLAGGMLAWAEAGLPVEPGA
jgi:rhodanese-related sulfurtransferase